MHSFIKLGILSCKNRVNVIEQNKIVTPIMLVDSLNEVLLEKTDFIYFYRSIGAFNKNHYYIIANSNNLTLIKVNENGISKYRSPFWVNSGYQQIIVDKIKLDDVNRDSLKRKTYQSHAPWFVLQVYRASEIIEFSNFYYELDSLKELNNIIILLERDILNAEQDKTYWIPTTVITEKMVLRNPRSPR